MKENIETTKYLGTDTMDVEELLDILGLREHQFKFSVRTVGRSAAEMRNWKSAGKETESAFV